MSVREEVVRLVERIPEGDLDVVKRMLAGLLAGRDGEEDPLRAFLESCPEDDEPTTDEDLAAIRAGREELARGELIPHEEVARTAAGQAAWATGSPGEKQPPRSSTACPSACARASNRLWHAWPSRIEAM